MLTKLARGAATALRRLAETPDDQQRDDEAVAALKTLTDALREGSDLAVLGRAQIQLCALTRETVVVDDSLVRWAKRWELWADAYDVIAKRSRAFA